MTVRLVVALARLHRWASRPSCSQDALIVRLAGVAGLAVLVVVMVRVVA